MRDLIAALTLLIAAILTPSHALSQQIDIEAEQQRIVSLANDGRAQEALAAIVALNDALPVTMPMAERPFFKDLEALARKNGEIAYAFYRWSGGADRDRLFHAGVRLGYVDAIIETMALFSMGETVNTLKPGSRDADGLVRTLHTKAARAGVENFKALVAERVALISRGAGPAAGPAEPAMLAARAPATPQATPPTLADSAQAATSASAVTQGQSLADVPGSRKGFALYQQLTTAPLHSVYLIEDPCTGRQPQRVRAAVHFERMQDAADVELIEQNAMRVLASLSNSRRIVCQELRNLRGRLAIEMATYFGSTPVLETVVDIQARTPSDVRRQVSNVRQLAASDASITRFAAFFDDFLVKTGPLYRVRTGGLLPGRLEPIRIDVDLAMRLIDAEIQSQPANTATLQAFRAAVLTTQARAGHAVSKTRITAALSRASEEGDPFSTGSVINADFAAIDHGIRSIRAERALSAEASQAFERIAPYVKRGQDQSSWAAHDLMAALRAEGAALPSSGVQSTLSDAPRRSDVERGLHRFVRTGQVGADVMSSILTQGQLPPRAAFDCGRRWCSIAGGVARFRYVSKGRPECQGSASRQTCSFPVSIDVRVNEALMGAASAFSQGMMSPTASDSWVQQSGTFVKTNDGWQMETWDR